MRWVRQEHFYGCQVAACAMILGVSYGEALALYPYEPLERGFSHIIIDNILVEQGFAIGRRYRHNAATGRDRSPWPPAPWAELHYCEVTMRMGGHAVVMLADGTVLDPNIPEPRRLTDYEQVQSVAAVIPMGRP